MINFWNVETLSNEEIKCLLIAFDKILIEIKVILFKINNESKLLGATKRI